MTIEKHHPSFERLVQATGESDRLALAVLIGQTKDVVNNWAVRPTGVSKDGAIAIEAKTGISPAWLLTGVMPPASDYLAKRQPIADKPKSSSGKQLQMLFDAIPLGEHREPAYNECFTVLMTAIRQAANPPTDGTTLIQSPKTQRV